jgi:hypothetical protein
MTQTTDILRILKLRGTITPLEALDEVGCFRLAARISDLRAEGYPIVTEWVGVKRHARYRLVPDPVQVTLFFADAV